MNQVFKFMISRWHARVRTLQRPPINPTLHCAVTVTRDSPALLATAWFWAERAPRHCLRQRGGNLVAGCESMRNRSESRNPSLTMNNKSPQRSISPTRGRANVPECYRHEADAIADAAYERRLFQRQQSQARREASQRLSRVLSFAVYFEERISFISP